MHLEEQGTQVAVAVAVRATVPGEPRPGRLGARGRPVRLGARAVGTPLLCGNRRLERGQGSGERVLVGTPWSLDPDELREF